MTKKEIRRIGKSKNIPYTDIEHMICEIYHFAESEKMYVVEVFNEDESELFTSYVNSIKKTIKPESGSVFERVGDKVMFYEDEEVKSVFYEIEQDWLTVIALLVLYDYSITW